MLMPILWWIAFSAPLNAGSGGLHLKDATMGRGVKSPRQPIAYTTPPSAISTVACHETGDFVSIAMGYKTVKIDENSSAGFGVDWKIYQAKGGELKEVFEKTQPKLAAGEFVSRVQVLPGGQWLAVAMMDDLHRSRMELVSSKDGMPFPDTYKHLKSGETSGTTFSRESTGFYMAKVWNAKGDNSGAILFDLENRTSKRIEGPFRSVGSVNRTGKLFTAKTDGYCVFRMDGTRAYPPGGREGREMFLRQSSLRTSSDGEKVFFIVRDKENDRDVLVTLSGSNFDKISEVPMLTNRNQVVGYLPVHDGKLVVAQRYNEERNGASGEYEVLDASTGELLGIHHSTPGQLEAECGSYLLMKERAGTDEGPKTFILHPVDLTTPVMKAVTYSEPPLVESLARDIRSQEAPARYRASRYLEQNPSKVRSVLNPSYGGRNALTPEETAFLKTVKDTFALPNFSDRNKASNRLKEMAESLSPDTFEKDVAPLLRTLTKDEDQEVVTRAKTRLDDWNARRSLTSPELKARLAALGL